MAQKPKTEPQNPLILRCQRLIEAFGKSDDERDFYLDRLEGFIVFVDLNKAQEDLDLLEKELITNSDRYCMIPKLTFYETKKIMEGFVNEKVYDIDTKEKLLDIIQSKEARENFLEFIYDHHTELEKWQQFYQERSRIRIIEWLRNSHFNFVFEEDLDLVRSLTEKLKRHLFDTKVGKDILAARKVLQAKAKTYYSNEALNPRPKRGRPPKQAAKLEVETQVSTDIYTTVPTSILPFLFAPDHGSASIASFSSKFETEEDLLASRRAVNAPSFDVSLESLHLKLASLRKLSDRWIDTEKNGSSTNVVPPVKTHSFDADSDDEDADEIAEVDGHSLEDLSGPASKVKEPRTKATSVPLSAKSSSKTKAKPVPVAVKTNKPTVAATKKTSPKSKTPPPPPKKSAPQKTVTKKPVPKKPAAQKSVPKKAPLRSIIPSASKSKKAPSGRHIINQAKTKKSK